MDACPAEKQAYTRSIYDAPIRSRHGILIEECNRPRLFVGGASNHEDNDVLRSDAMVRDEDLTALHVNDGLPL